ncbi:MAG: hypothetical protein PHD40_00140 [Syntrophomonadaceae bacterium]|nr:hypothetical protein [Syntrophomonadaceae bacterium]
MKSLSRYEVTDKTRFTDSWIWLTLLLIVGFIVWRTVSSLAALSIALAGMIIIGLIYRSSKQHVGNTVEITDQAMIFKDADQQSCIAFNEIKKVKTNRLLSLLGDPAFIIETSTGKKRWLQPDDYNNGEKLREELNRHLNVFIQSE